MIDDRFSAPKADALPGCATPRPAKTHRFLTDEPLAEDGFRGNSVQNAAGTGVPTPELFPNCRYSLLALEAPPPDGRVQVGGGRP